MSSSHIGHRAPDDLVALSARARRVMEAILRIDDEHEDLAWAQRALDEVALRLEALGKPGEVPRLDPAGSEGRPYYFPGNFERSVRLDTPEVEAEQQGRSRRGRVRFTLAHEGPPGCVHGGYLAWFFDSILGLNIIANELHAPTHRLEVVYRRPAPLLRELDYEAHIERTEGRSVFVRATLADGETLLAEATGEFVRLRSADGTPMVRDRM